MGRLLFLLRLLVPPLCLVQSPNYPNALAERSDDTPPLIALNTNISDDILATFALAPQGNFPEAMPWTTLWRTHTRLPHPDPLVFLQKCVERYDRDVKSYTLTFRKRERLKGQLNKPEEILVHYQDQPHSVYFQWQDGARLVTRVVYAASENDGKMLVRAKLGGIILEKDVDGAEAKNSGRMPINKFGLKQGLERVLTRCVAAGNQGTLSLDYVGVFQVAQVGDRRCYVFHRSKYAEAEDDGVTDLVLYIDMETWLLAGTISRGLAPDTDGNLRDNQLIAEYCFRDIRLNPQFPAHQFERAALKQ